MPEPEQCPVTAHDLTVAMDYGQFSLSGLAAVAGDALDRLLRAAMAGDGVASDCHTLLILSPHQNNFEMVMRAELWGQEPPDDLGAWEEAIESVLRVDDGYLHYDSPTLPGARYAVPAGEYHIRVCGRGFITRGWPGSTTPGDRWRAQLWAASAGAPARARHLRVWAC